MAKQLDFDHCTELMLLLLPSTPVAHWFGQGGTDPLEEAQFSPSQDTSLSEDLSFEIEPWEES